MNQPLLTPRGLAGFLPLFLFLRIRGLGPLGPERFKAPERYQIYVGEFFVLREQGLTVGDVDLRAVNQYLSQDFVRELLEKVEIS